MTEHLSSNSKESTHQALFRAIASEDRAAVTRVLTKAPELARLSAAQGATRENASSYYLEEISHYVYAGDTALHQLLCRNKLIALVERHEREVRPVRVFKEA